MLIDMSQHFSMRELIFYSLPSIAMMLFSSIYGIVDGFFISNYVGKTAFAAANLIMPCIMILSVTGFMIGTGGSALIAKTRGEGEEKQANDYFSLLIYFAFALGVVLAIIGWFIMRPAAQLLGASPEMVDYCEVYGRICMLSLPFFSLQFAFQTLFVTAGKPNTGFLVIVIAGVTNMVLDFVLVGLLGLGLEGAASATVIGEYLGGGLPLIYFARKNPSFLRLGKTKLQWNVIGKACVNGSSEMVANIAMSLVGMLYNWQLMRMLGEDGVAAYGIIMYLGMIFGSVYFGYNMGTSPLLSFQYGAQNHKEMRSIFKKSLGFVWLSGVVIFIACQVSAEALASIFTSYDQQLHDLTTFALRLYSISFLFMGYAIYGSAFFTALNNGVVSAIISFLRTLLFETSAVIILPALIGSNGIWLSVSVAEVAGCIITAIFMVALRKRYGYGKPKGQESADLDS